METIQFIFWEGMKGFALVFLCLLAAKAIANLRRLASEDGSRRVRVITSVFYGVVVILGVLGARILGNDIAAFVYARASGSDLSQGKVAQAYGNATRAVQLRPAALRYWQALAAVKLAARQYESLLDDMPAFKSLSCRELQEADEYRFAVCYFGLGKYDRAIRLTERLIKQSHFYAAPYVLQGTAYIAEKKYNEAEQTFLSVLRIFPEQEAAVEGLAHAYFLSGDRDDAIGVLNTTAKYPFSQQDRKRFESLKSFYAQ